MWLYRLLLGLYPATVRARFGDEMAQLFGDQLRDARARRSPLGIAAVWFRGLADLVSSAASEHVRGDRGIGHSLAEPPSGVSRLLGILGIVGGLWILAAFVAQPLIFETLPALITVRILLFNLGAIAVVVGLRGGASGWARSRSGTAIAWAAVLANGCYAGMTLLPVIGWAPFAGDHYLTAFLAGVAMWVTDAAFGLVVARRGRLVGLAGSALVVGSVLALLGMDRLGLTRGALADLFVTLSLAGQAIGGFAWVALGIDVATRHRQAAATAEARARKA